MSFWNFIKTRQFWIHFGLIVLAIVLFLWLTFKFLNLYTFHGQSVEVPDFSGYTMEEIEDLDGANDFNFEVTDSIYDLSKKPGSVVNQTPSANSAVKKGRTIYLTLVSFEAEMVSLPDLNSLSRAAAIRQLEGAGLKMAKIEYVPGDANVVRAKYNGKNIDWGTKLEKGSKITIVMGKGKGGGKVNVPNLIGKSRKKAKRMIDDAGLLIGSEIFDDPEDTVNVSVRKQSPSYDKDKEINLGESIDLWYE